MQPEHIFPLSIVLNPAESSNPDLVTVSVFGTHNQRVYGISYHQINRIQVEFSIEKVDNTWIEKRSGQPSERAFVIGREIEKHLKINNL